jgi:osmoprotectant transport system ATP-binding protein
VIRFRSVSCTYVGPADARADAAPSGARDGVPDRPDPRAVRDLTLDIVRGETLALVGPSGCGKTSTLRLVNRMVEASAGRVLVGEEDVLDLDPIRLRRRIGYVIQSGGLFPHLDVRENVGLLCRLEGWDRARARERVDSLLELVHLSPAEFAGRHPGELSGGQRQRVGVARALALDPEILLMDEPFGALDPITRAQLQEEFLDLRRRFDKTVLLVSHDLDEAFLLADRVALMRAGELVQAGTREEFRRAPQNPWVEQFMQQHAHVE